MEPCLFRSLCFDRLVLVVQIDPSCPLFEGLSSQEKVLLTHGDSVTDKTVASGFRVVSRTSRLVAGSWFSSSRTLLLRHCS